MHDNDHAVYNEHTERVVAGSADIRLIICIEDNAVSNKLFLAALY